MRQHALEVCAPHALARTLPPCADRHAPRDLVYELLPALAQLLESERERQQEHPTVDVVSHPARGDDPVWLLGGRHTSHRESVALMDVRHRQREVDDAGERRHVRKLLERAIVLDRLHQLRVREQPRGHPHPRDRPAGYLPQIFVETLQRQLRHRAPPRHGTRDPWRRTEAGDT